MLFSEGFLIHLYLRQTLKPLSILVAISEAHTNEDVAGKICEAAQGTKCDEESCQCKGSIRVQ